MGGAALPCIAGPAGSAPGLLPPSATRRRGRELIAAARAGVYTGVRRSAGAGSLAGLACECARAKPPLGRSCSALARVSCRGIRPSRPMALGMVIVGGGSGQTAPADWRQIASRSHSHFAARLLAGASKTWSTTWSRSRRRRLPPPRPPSWHPARSPLSSQQSVSPPSRTACPRRTSPSCCSGGRRRARGT